MASNPPEPPGDGSPAGGPSDAGERPREPGERPREPEGRPREPEERPRERYGPLAIERRVKDDGRALLLYARAEAERA